MTSGGERGVRPATVAFVKSYHDLPDTAPHRTFPSPPAHPPDIVASSGGDGKIRWFRSRGVDNGYESFTVTHDAPGASSVAVGDVDGDGIADVVASSAMDDTVRWLN